MQGYLQGAIFSNGSATPFSLFVVDAAGPDTTRKLGTVLTSDLGQFPLLTGILRHAHDLPLLCCEETIRTSE